MVGPVGRIVKLVGSGVGLARESYLERQRSKSSLGIERATDPGPAAGPSDDPPQYVEVDEVHADELIKSGKAEAVDLDDDSTDDDEEEWRLDEAADEIDPPSYNESEALQRTESEAQQATSKLVHAVLEQAPPASSKRAALPLPVVIPQRRPRAKGRGFVRAYAPVLDDSAIDQKTFLTFLKSYHEASKASKFITVIFIGAGIVGMAPEVIAMAVSTAIQIAAGAAAEIQKRNRSNVFLDEMNEKLFKPRGLYAVVMSFKPDATRPVSAGEFDPSATIAKYGEQAGSSFKKHTRNLRLASGKTYGEMDIGEVAPLVFPALEEAASDPEKAGNLKKAQKFLAEYGDKRAQAEYQAKYPGSKLAAPEPVQFQSRYSDPNHPANNGSLISLLSGGHLNPKARKMARREQRNTRREARGLPLKRTRNRDKDKGIIKRVLTEDVLYLMVVNLPSEAELAAAKERLAREKH